MRDWIIYAVFGVLVCLLLWRVNSAEAGNRRASLIILGVVALAMVAWQDVRLLPVGVTTAHTERQNYHGACRRLAYERTR